MLPPIVRRCPDCGYLGFAYRFERVTEEDRQWVECPRCGHRIEIAENPWLAALRLRS